MGFLRQSSNPANVWKYTGVQIQTSSNVVPLAIVYGTNRLAPNVIWTGGFYAIPQYQKGGGKGGGNGAVQGYTYYTSFLMGLCEGPITNYNTTFLNQQYLFGLTGSDWSKRQAARRRKPHGDICKRFFQGKRLVIMASPMLARSITISGRALTCRNFRLFSPASPELGTAFGAGTSSTVSIRTRR